MATEKQKNKKSTKTGSNGDGSLETSAPADKKGKTNKTATTMEELLELEGVELRGLRRGDIVEGTVTEIGPKSVFIDIGAKTEGMVIDKEYNVAESYIRTLQMGDKVDTYVVSPENESGQIILSLRSAASNYIWSKIDEWQTSGEILTVRVKEVNRGGAIVGVVDELEGFIPGSQFTSQLADSMNELVGKDVQVRIIDSLREETKLILSEKSVSEAEDLAKKQAVMDMLVEGEIYKGVVTRVVPFGVFVKLELPKDQKSKKSKDQEAEGPEGLVHISELSWEKVTDSAMVAKQGDRVDVKVIKADPKVGKLSLSFKQLTSDPWEEIEKKYPVDKKVAGVVSEVMPFGVFVQLEPGIAGLIHVSKMLGKSFKKGNKVDCYVETVDRKGRRISLGLMLTAKPIGYK